MLSTIFVYTKDAVTLLIPFYLINLFFKTYYQTNIFSVASWWFKYHSEIEYKAPLFLGTAFLVFALFATVGLTIQKLSLSVHGESYTLIYVGDSTPTISNFVKPDQIDAETVSYRDFIGSSSFSFANIYRETKFIRDSGTDRLGAPVSSFSFANLVTVFLWTLSLMPAFFVALHTYAYLVSIKAETMDFTPVVPVMDALVAHYPSLKITPFKLIGATLGVVLLALVFGALKPSEKNVLGKKAIQLPHFIKPGHQVQGLPINLKRNIYESDDSPDIDTGFRTIIFKFEKDFPTPVYVSYYYDSKEYPYLEELTDNNIEQEQLMNLTIVDDLGLDVSDYE